MPRALESADAKRFPDGHHQLVFAMKDKSGPTNTGVALIVARLAKAIKSGARKGNAAFKLAAEPTKSGTNPTVNVSATVPLTGTMTQANAWVSSAVSAGCTARRADLASSTLTTSMNAPPNRNGLSISSDVYVVKDTTTAGRNQDADASTAVAKENGQTSRISATLPRALLARSITAINVNADQTSTKSPSEVPASAFRIARLVTCGPVI